MDMIHSRFKESMKRENALFSFNFPNSTEETEFRIISVICDSKMLLTKFKHGFSA